MLFYDGRGRYAFPPEYYNQVFIAQHGSWDATVPRGYKVTRVGTDPQGNALFNTSRDFFAYQGPGEAWPTQPGTPGTFRAVEVKVGPQGELYVSSDESNQIVVIRHINDLYTPVLVPQLRAAGYNYSTAGGPTKASAEFSFNQPRTQGMYRWAAGTYPHLGVAQFDGGGLYVNMSAPDNSAGAASPNVTGGTSTYEMWININAVASTGTGYVVLELLQPGATAAQDDYFRILAQVSANRTTATVWAVAKPSGGVEAAVTGVQQFTTAQWHHLAVVVNATSGVLCIDGCTTSTAPVSAHVPLIARSSALLGHTYRYAANGSLHNFTGYLDDVRLYSYALSLPQLNLNWLFSVADPIPAVLQATLNQQPPENSEAQYSVVGPANHYAPQPAASLFPGWVNLNGAQLVNLSNPMSGAGAVWAGNLFTFIRPGSSSPALTAELWFRLSNTQQLAGGATVTLLSAQPLAQVTLSSSLLKAQINGVTVQVAFSNAAAALGWTHLVVLATPSNGGTSSYYIYINGTAAASVNGSGFVPTPVGSSVTLGGAASGGVVRGIVGDLGAFRLYSFAVNANGIKALYNTQLLAGASH